MPRPGTFCCIKIQRSQAALWLGSMRCSGAGPRRVVEAGHAVRQPDATLFHHPRRGRSVEQNRHERVAPDRGIGAALD